MLTNTIALIATLMIPRHVFLLQPHLNVWRLLWYMHGLFTSLFSPDRKTSVMMQLPQLKALLAHGSASSLYSLGTCQNLTPTPKSFSSTISIFSCSKCTLLTTFALLAILLPLHNLACCALHHVLSKVYILCAVSKDIGGENNAWNTLCVVSSLRCIVSFYLILKKLHTL